MPTATQLNGVRTRCRWCCKALTTRQRLRGRKCCSDDCKLALHRHNGGHGDFDGIKEPKTPDEVAACDAQIAQGKRDEALAHIALKARWTPRDESPEAERRLREGACVAVCEDEE